MARGVLGNDPFQRGAPSREKKDDETPAPTPDAKKPKKKAVGPAKKAAAPAKKPATAKRAAPARKKKPAAAPEPEAPVVEATPVAEPIAPVAVEPLGAEAVVEEPVIVREPVVAELEPAMEVASAVEPPVEAPTTTEPSGQSEFSEPSAPSEPEMAGITWDVPALPGETTARPVEPVPVSAAARGEIVQPSVAERAAEVLALGRRIVEQVSSAEFGHGVAQAALGLARAVQTGLGTSGSTALDDYGQDPRLVQQLDALRSFLFERYWRVQVEGAENVPAGPVLLVANHSGALPLDGPVLQEALRRHRGDLAEARWLVEDQVFYAPFLGTILNRLGAVRACPENAVRLLGEGRPVIVFPEGMQGIGKPFRDRYRLMRFGRGGLVKLALRTRAPILPVAIVGAEEAMPLFGRLPGRAFGVPYLPLTSPVPLPSRWIIRFAEPIRIDDHPPEAADDLSVVQSLNDRTRETVQGMIDGLLRDRASVF